MGTNKTVANDADVLDFLATLDEQQRRDSETLVSIMQDVSGEPPVMWGTSIVGFGVLHYKYASGRTGDCSRIGFAPRKGKITLYMTCYVEDLENELAKLGKHKTGKGCIYIEKLSDVNSDSLRKLIEAGFAKAGSMTTEVT